MAAPYPILEVQPGWVLEPEALGSKEKFWYRAEEGQPQWLFKFPQPNTGQHWAEKIAAEIAARMAIRHGVVELAIFRGTRGSATETFVRKGQNLFHGNQILDGNVFGYDPAKEFHQSDHTLANVLLALDRAFVRPAAARRVKRAFAEYLVLDAVIGNTDRHHENWGILRRPVEGRWKGWLAPTFDHASSLGRELLDTAPGKCREKILAQNRIEKYAENASGAVFWDNQDKRGVSPLELVRRAARLHPELFKSGLVKLIKLERQTIESIVERVPEDWMSPLAREFAIALVCYNVQELRRISL